MKDTFPTDIYAVKRCGINKWQREFFWPVADKDFVSLYLGIEKCIRGHIEKQDPEMSRLLLIQADLRFEYLSFIHALKVIDEVKKAGRELQYSDQSFLYGNMIANKLSVPPPVKIIERINLLQAARDRALKTAKGLIYNSHPAKLIAAARKNTAYVYNSMNPVMEKYLGHSKEFSCFTSNLDWFAGRRIPEISRELKNSIQAVSEAIIGEMTAIAHRENIRLSDDHTGYLNGLTMTALADAARLEHSASACVFGKKNAHILISSFGNPLLRTVALAARKNGAKVTSFTHGGHIGLHNVPTVALSEFALSDEFVTYTKASINNFERIRTNYRLERYDSTRIDSCESDEFLKYWQKHGKKPMPKHIKKIMVIGYPHNPWRKPHASASLSLMHLDLELRLVDMLCKAGYEVLYKVHPDREGEAEGIFDSRVKMVLGYFEDNLDGADAYVFGSIRTTAFPIALCTNKPIVGFIMADEQYKPFPEAMDLLKKRCHLVACDFDGRNRLSFNKDAFLDILAGPIKGPNNEFLETYYLPGNR